MMRGDADEACFDSARDHSGLHRRVEHLREQCDDVKFHRAGRPSVEQTGNGIDRNPARFEIDRLHDVSDDRHEDFPRAIAHHHHIVRAGRENFGDVPEPPSIKRYYFTAQRLEMIELTRLRSRQVFRVHQQRAAFECGAGVGLAYICENDPQTAMSKRRYLDDTMGLASARAFEYHPHPGFERCRIHVVWTKAHRTLKSVRTGDDADAYVLARYLMSRASRSPVGQGHQPPTSLR